MSDIFDYLRPVDSAITDNLEENVLIKAENIFSDKDKPDLENCKVAIFGIMEDRRSENNQGCGLAPDEIRAELYQLNRPDSEIRIVDLGNILPGESYEDTCFAIRTVCEQLLRKDIIPLIIGGSQDLTYANYQAYESLEQVINLVSIDNRIDLSEDEEIHSNSFLRKIVLHQPNYLFNFCNIGHQRPLVKSEQLETLDKLYFDILRLGVLFENSALSEPYLRNADIVSIDISSVRRADAPGSSNTGPNGLYADQICQMCKYAGMSDKLSSFGIYEYNPDMDRDQQTSQLIAQMIWYFIEGVANRKSDYPIGSKEDYLKFTVPLDREGYEIVFYKSPATDRWWMDVPYPAGTKNKYQRHHLVPCSYNDYQTAANDDIPDLWWRTFQKLV